MRSSAHLPLTPSVLVAEVREAPHVAQADDGACDRQDELYLVAPLAPLLHLLLGGLRAGPIGEARFDSVSYKTDKRQKEYCSRCNELEMFSQPPVTSKMPRSKAPRHQNSGDRFCKKVI